MLDLSGKPVVVIGGGAVALRKITGLLAAGATRVRVVAPRLHADMPPAIEHLPAEYDPKHLDGAALVFAATDSPAVNAAVVRDARHRGILVNRADADAPGESDFATPAVHRDRGITLTVSAAGSPALAARVRDEVAARLDPAWGELANVSHDLRPRVIAAVGDPRRRREIFRALAGDDALAAVKRGGAPALESWLTTAFPELEPTNAGGGGRHA